MCRIGLALFSLLLCFSGCGAAKSNVAGKVTWNGEPVRKGIVRIIHQSMKNEGGPLEVSLPIQDGTYSSSPESRPFAGEQRIEIYAQKGTGKKVLSPVPNTPTFENKMETVELTRQFLPAQFNTASTLKATLVGGDNVQDFDLKGQELTEEESKPRLKSGREITN